MELSIFQFGVISNLMSLTVAAMGAAAVFFVLSRSQVAQAYRPALLISGIVVGIACYHYYRIAGSFADAYVLEGGRYIATGQPFNDAYRYADWLLTVPLLVIELIAVMNLARPMARSLNLRLGGAAVLMIALGYPGEVSAGVGGAIFWWLLAMVPFLYIVRTLYGEFGDAVERQPSVARPLVEKARLLTVASWTFYPIAYLGGLGAGAGATTLLQVGYTVSDLVAKVGLGLFIYAIARAKSSAEGYVPADHPAPVGETAHRSEAA